MRSVDLGLITTFLPQEVVEGTFDATVEILRGRKGYLEFAQRVNVKLATLTVHQYTIPVGWVSRYMHRAFRVDVDRDPLLIQDFVAWEWVRAINYATGGNGSAYTSIRLCKLLKIPGYPKERAEVLISEKKC